jgi:hypothetical protein
LVEVFPMSVPPFPVSANHAVLEVSIFWKTDLARSAILT